MDDALGNPLAVLVSQFLDQLPVLHENRASITGGETVLVVSNRGASAGRQAWSGGVSSRHSHFLAIGSYCSAGQQRMLVHDHAGHQQL
jgi:hypothetical protein